MFLTELVNFDNDFNFGQPRHRQAMPNWLASIVINIYTCISEKATFVTDFSLQNYDLFKLLQLFPGKNTKTKTWNEWQN